MFSFQEEKSAPQNKGALSTCLLSSVWILPRWKLPKDWIHPMLLCFANFSLGYDVIFTGQRLIWDESIYALDSRRYTLVQTILKDLSSPKSRVSAHRLSSVFSIQHPFWSGDLDFNTASTNFSLSALLPNTGMIYGIEEISGYLSLHDPDRDNFFKIS
jgi:hypothetical protein